MQWRRATVPLIWPLEVANAVRMGERRQRSTEAQAAKWLTYLGFLPIAVAYSITNHKSKIALPAQIQNSKILISQLPIQNLKSKIESPLIQ